MSTLHVSLQTAAQTYPPQTKLKLCLLNGGASFVHDGPVHGFVMRTKSSSRWK